MTNIPKAEAPHVLPYTLISGFSGKPVFCALLGNQTFTANRSGAPQWNSKLYYQRRWHAIILHRGKVSPGPEQVGRRSDSVQRDKAREEKAGVGRQLACD